MIPRISLALAVSATMLVAGGEARSGEPAKPAAVVAGSEARSGEPAKPARHGAVVVAIDDGATAAAKALARTVYADPSLRPSLDEVSARVLTGEPAAEGSSPMATELAEVRVSIRNAASEAVARRLLVSIGEQVGAAGVIAVSSAQDKQRPTARVLHVTTASYESESLFGALQEDPDGSAAITWPGAATVIRAWLAPPSLAAAPAQQAAAPARVPMKTPPPSRSWATSPWFWGPLGGLVAAGLGVFALSRTSNDTGTVHLAGRISP